MNENKFNGVEPYTETEVQPVKKVRKQRSDKGQKRTKPYNLKKNKENPNV